MSVLFEPKKIGSVTLKNRFIKSSTAESMAGNSGEVTAPLVDFYDTLARGGMGCIFLGHAYVHPAGKAHPKMTGLHTDSNIAGFKSLADTIHRHHCAVFAQLNYAGSRIQKDFVEPVGPSAVTNPFSAETARELHASEIDEIINAFGLAAGRAQQAGLDGILIHGGHGYLVSCFNSPYTNRRTDQWGRNPEARSRFILKVFEAIRHAVGPDFPIMVKLGIRDDVENGLSIAEGASIASRLAQAGIDGIEISGGLPVKKPVAQSRSGVLSGDQEAYFLPYAQAVRSKVGNLPLSLVGGLRSPRLMEEIVKQGDTDFVSLARPFICEPDLVSKIAMGRWEPVGCDRCDRCKINFAEEALCCRRENGDAA